MTIGTHFSCSLGSCFILGSLGEEAVLLVRSISIGLGLLLYLGLAGLLREVDLDWSLGSCFILGSLGSSEVDLDWLLGLLLSWARWAFVRSISMALGLLLYLGPVRFFFSMGGVVAAMLGRWACVVGVLWRGGNGGSCATHHKRKSGRQYAGPCFVVYART